VGRPASVYSSCATQRKLCRSLAPPWASSSEPASVKAFSAGHGDGLSDVMAPGGPPEAAGSRYGDGYHQTLTPPWCEQVPEWCCE
jgi:hypothetical protein